MTTLEMAFAPSAQPAGAGLQPGECALVERAFLRNEIMQVRDPIKVRFETPANSQLKQSQHGRPFFNRGRELSRCDYDTRLHAWLGSLLDVQRNESW